MAQINRPQSIFIKTDSLATNDLPLTLPVNRVLLRMVVLFCSPPAELGWFRAFGRLLFTFKKYKNRKMPHVPGAT